jgi:hypothetical protein
MANFRERFDGEMQVLPIPSDVPAEIPRIIMQSSDGQWRLSMGPARFDSVWQNNTPSGTSSLSYLVQKCFEVQERYVRENNIRVSRTALIIHRTSPCLNPAQDLIHRFCNEKSQREPFNRSESFEIHNHKVYLLRADETGFEINSWVRCKAAKLLADSRSVILVEQDLNTVPKESDSNSFDPDQIAIFFQKAALEADEIFRKYFPV